jgi:heme-degrading monooxygenase HmoA
VTLVEDEKDDSSKVTTTVYDCGNDNDERQGNYVSFTVWEKKSDFSAWRKGEAFKEAHGGTSLVAFVTTLISSARTLQGAPKPAFYDGLLVQSMRPETIPKLVDGWRETSSAGDLSQVLDAECFIACNQFFVPPENAKAFEDRWAQRESKLKECDGFVAFMMNRRDGQQKGHGTVPISENDPTYVSTTIWRDVKAFQNWRNSLQFNKAHGGGSSSGGDKKDGDTEEKPASPPKPLWTKPPAAIFYEGTLVITTEDGA